MEVMIVDCQGTYLRGGNRFIVSLFRLVSW